MHIGLCVLQLYERIKSEINSSQHAPEVTDDNVKLAQAAVEQAKKVHGLLSNQVGKYFCDIFITHHCMKVLMY